MFRKPASWFLAAVVSLAAIVSFPGDVLALSSCWCRQLSDNRCNHYTAPRITGNPTATDYGDDLVCNSFCASLPGPGGRTETWVAVAAEDSYRAAVCTEPERGCVGVAGSSCAPIMSPPPAAPPAAPAAGSGGASSPSAPATAPAAAPAASTAPATTATPPPERPPIPITLGIPIGNVRQVSGIAEYINLGYRYLVSIILIATIVMVVWGGFRYLLGSANIGNVQRGKEIIRDAVVGMLIVIGAFVILNTVNPRTVELRDLSLSNIRGQGFNLNVAGGARTSCSSDADCTAGSRCVEAGFVFNTDENMVLAGTAGIGAIGAAVGARYGGVYGAVIGGASGVALGSYITLGSRSMRCSDGTVSAPCSENSHCTAGNVCYTNWHLCGPSNGRQPVGGACQENGHCANNNCQPYPSDYAFQSVFEGVPASCRGTIERLTAEQYARAGYTVPETSRCSINADCKADQGLVCGGPGGLRKRFCVYGSTDVNRTASEGELCFMSGSGRGGQIYPSSCGGTRLSPFACLYCPTEGERTWQRLTIGPSQSGIMGSCRPLSAVGGPCSGPAAR